MVFRSSPNLERMLSIISIRGVAMALRMLSTQRKQNERRVVLALSFGQTAVPNKAFAISAAVVTSTLLIEDHLHQFLAVSIYIVLQLVSRDTNVGSSGGK